MSIGQEEKDAVMRVMERGVLSGYQGNASSSFYGGPEIKLLEEEWSRYFKINHAIAANSATSGLWMACAAIGLTLGDECIVSPYSMTCSASMPLHFGAIPVFADIEKDYYCLDPKSVEKAITERTRTIIIVDLFGQPYAADEIYGIAEKYSLKYGHKIYVIEDAAQAIGARFYGKYAGTLGDIGVFSLNRHKHIQCGEGGIVVTDNDDLAMKIRLAMNHSEAVVSDMLNMGKSLVNEESLSPLTGLVGMNMRMPELSAAIAREQLKKLSGILENIREHAKYFPVKVRPGCESAYYRYAWNDSDGNDLARYLRGHNLTLPSNGFNFKDHYIKPLHQMPLFKSLGYPDGLCPVCQEVEENIVLAWLKGSGM